MGKISITKEIPWHFIIPPKHSPTHFVYNKTSAQAEYNFRFNNHYFEAEDHQHIAFICPGCSNSRGLARDAGAKTAGAKRCETPHCSRHSEKQTGVPWVCPWKSGQACPLETFQRIWIPTEIVRHCWTARNKWFGLLLVLGRYQRNQTRPCLQKTFKRGHGPKPGQERQSKTIVAIFQIALLAESSGYGPFHRATNHSIAITSSILHVNKTFSSLTTPLAGLTFPRL